MGRICCESRGIVPGCINLVKYGNRRIPVEIAYSFTNCTIVARGAGEATTRRSGQC